MKRKISLSLVLAMALSLFGFQPLTANAEPKPVKTTIVSPSDVKKDKPTVEKKADISKKEKEAVFDVDPDKMVRVIVELQEESIVEKANKSKVKVKDMGKAKINQMEKALRGNQNALKNRMKNKVKMQDKVKGQKAAGISVTVGANAFSTFMRYGDIDKAKEEAGVKRIVVANEFERPMMNTSVDQVQAPTAWTNYQMDGEGSVVAIVDSGVDHTHKDFVLSEDTVPALTESYVNSLGLPGKYFTEKVPYGYNYYDLNTYIKDHGDDGQHGQHVAGTVAANGEIKGVAPEAQLLAMKVFSDDILYSTTFSDIYLKAIDDSIKLGADAINMSLGSPSGFYVLESMEDTAINNARENGVLVAISAGNEHNSMEGAENFIDILGVYITSQSKNPDNGLVGSPSVNEGSISVASVENTHLRARSLVYAIDGAEKTTQMNPATGSPNPWEVFDGPMAVLDAGYGLPEDFAGKDFSGKIALVQRGEISFLEKLANAEAAGAAGIIIYNHADGGDSMINMVGGETATIPYVFIGHTAGMEMIEALMAGKEVLVTFSEEMGTFLNDQGGYLSDFSSWGPSPVLTMKPEISAPGGMIYSTQNDDGYTNMSGTSMAAPHVSGGIAIVAQRLREDATFGFPTMTAKTELAKTLLMNTAEPFADPNGNLYGVRQQGAGLMKLAYALENDVTVLNENGKPKVEFGEVSKSNIKVTLTLKNYGDKPLTFKPESTLLTETYASDGAGHFVSLETTQKVAHKTNLPATVTVPAHGSTRVKVNVNFKDGIGTDPTKSLTRNQFLEGFIRFISTDGNNPDLTMPMIGFYGDFDEPKVLDEWVWNMNDEDPSNDPEFLVTSLIQVGTDGIFFVNGTRDIWLNPKSEDLYKELYGTNTLGLVATVLRNAEEINFRITDAKGKVLRNIGQTTYQRKINRLYAGANPYTIFAESLWDGTVEGMDFAEGETVFYEIEVLRTKDSEPQVYRFPVRFDNVAPVISNVTYDPETNTVEFDATDEHSGVSIANVISEDFMDEVQASDDGKGHFKADVTSLMREEGTVVFIEVLDNAMNATYAMVEINGDGIARPEAPVVTASPASQTVVEGKTIKDVTIASDDPADEITSTPLPAALTFEEGVLSGTPIIEDWAEGELSRTLTITFTATDTDGLTGKVNVKITVLRDADGDGIGDEPPVREDDEYIKPQIQLYEPDLLTTHTGPVPFKGIAYGWENITKATITVEGKEIELPLSKIEKYSVKNADGTEAFFGTVYAFDTTIELPEAYYELPVTIYNDAGESFNVVRRFWVDMTAPTIESSYKKSGSKTAEITLEVSDNFAVLQVYQGDSLVANIDRTDEGFGKMNITETVKVTVSLAKGENTFTFRAIDIAGNETEHTVTILGGNNKGNNGKKK